MHEHLRALVQIPHHNIFLSLITRIAKSLCAPCRAAPYLCDFLFSPGNTPVMGLALSDNLSVRCEEWVLSLPKGKTQKGFDSFRGLILPRSIRAFSKTGLHKKERF